jgi:hypothetical protein
MPAALIATVMDRHDNRAMGRANDASEWADGWVAAADADYTGANACQQQEDRVKSPYVCSGSIIKVRALAGTNLYNCMFESWSLI